MFTRRSGVIHVTLGDDERQLLIQLAEQVIALIEPPDVPADPDPLERLVGRDGPSEPPNDPAVARLFPIAYPDDEPAAVDFRRYTEPALRARKVDAARVMVQVLQQGDGTDLAAEQAAAVLAALNDLRLILGTRLGVGEDRGEREPDPALDLYDYLTYLQGTLVEAIAG